MKFLKIRMKLFKKIFRNKKNFQDEKLTPKFIDNYVELSNIIKESRSNKNLTQEDLSIISKIPLFIIVAIENNDEDLIPEYPFIRSILLKLEECLSIRKFKLVNLVKMDKSPKDKRNTISYLINRFDLINSWQGNVIYILILLSSLLILNNYFINSKSIEFKFIEQNSSK